jgi:TPR repeat protein
LALPALAQSPPPSPPLPPAKPQQTPAPPQSSSNDANAPDLAYGAYQRGYFLTAFAEATKAVEQHGDVKAMALLGVLYSEGFGVPRDDAKAVQWFTLAAGRGDREAMFALANLKMSGRGGPADKAEAA